MSVGATKKENAGSTAQKKAVAALEEVFNTHFEVWVGSQCGDWSYESMCGKMSIAEDLGESSIGLLLEQCDSSGEPYTAELASGSQLLAIPLAGRRGGLKYCAIAEINSNSPDLLVQLALVKLREMENEADLVQLREENKFFLKQVSEDFEELAFLRLMAERLALGESANNASELITFLMPALGRTLSVEELYYLEGDTGSDLQVAQQWLPDAHQVPKCGHKQLEELVKRFGEEAIRGPVVKNQLVTTGLCPELPDLHELILVAVSTSMGPIGWLLGMNKIQSDGSADREHIWQLSYNEFGTPEASLLSTAGAMLASYAHNLAFIEERENLLVSVVRTLVSAIESKDDYTCGHSERVARYGKRLAKEVGYDKEACERLYLTGLLHDVGKIGVSDAVLKKEGVLTTEEFAEIQKHPELGWAILRELEQLDYVLPGVLHHHERVDGKGYPDQLGGDAIPQDGQLLAVVDAFDAMTSDRPYRKGMTVKKAVAIFEEGAGTQWNAALVEDFLKILPDILAIKDDYCRPPVPIRKKGIPRSGVVIDDSRAANCQPVWQLL